MNKKTLIPRTALLLGYAGVLPFAALAMGYVIGEYAAALQGFLLYGGLILSFLGGVRWGAAASPQPSSRALALSVLPSLWAFACLTLPGSLTGVWGLLLGFATLGIADLFAGFI